MKTLSTKAIKAITSDSPKNCLIKEPLPAPNTFLTPTSVDLLEERAVDKFIKLMQAINKVKKAMDARMYK